MGTSLRVRVLALLSLPDVMDDHIPDLVNPMFLLQQVLS